MAPTSAARIPAVPTSPDPYRPAGFAVGVLALAMTAAAVLGPVVLGLLDYRTSPTTLNQLIGSDAATLFVVAPLSLLAAVACRGGRPASALLASGVGVFAVYTYAQVVIGQEYLRLPGNVERFFPLLLAVFVLGWITVLLAWRAVPRDLPPPAARLERTAGIVLLLLAAFLVFGLHLPTMLTAWRDPAELTEYASSPTPFWLVKLMDLGIIVPGAAAIGAGLLRHAGWARRLIYPLLTGYSCLGVSVTAMAVVMILDADPDASPAVAAGFAAFTLAFAALTVLLYRALPARTASCGRPPSTS